jgi:hypothetical protein
LGEIKRTAAENGGEPLGRQRFFHETGIRQTEWLGKYWARWGDAVREAGYEPNKLQPARNTDELLEHLIDFMRELGRYPVAAELKLRARSKKGFPSNSAFARFGSKGQLAAYLQRYCKDRVGYEDVAKMCADVAQGEIKRTTQDEGSDEGENFGFVYLIRHGRYYKIGRTNAVGRRERELAISCPKKQPQFTP